MPIPHRRSAVWLLVAALVGLAAVWFIPVDITPSVHLPAKMVAASEWTLERTGQGTLTARLEERLEGVSSRYMVQSVDRGDVAELTLKPGLRAGLGVTVGDTIGTMHSAATETRMAEVEGLVSVSAAELAALAEGDKETLIAEARTRLDGLQALIGVHRRIVERLRQLNSTGAAAEAELDDALAEMIALEGEAEVMEAQIAVLESGARTADRETAARRLEAARRQLDALSLQRGALVIRSPLTGLVTMPPGDSVLVSVIDTTRWALLIPVPLELRATFTPGRVVVLDLDGSTARILQVSPSVTQVGGRSVIVAVAEGIGRPAEFLDRFTVAIRAESDPVRLRSWFVRELEALFRWHNWFGRAERV